MALRAPSMVTVCGVAMWLKVACAPSIHGLPDQFASVAFHFPVLAPLFQVSGSVPVLFKLTDQVRVSAPLVATTAMRCGAAVLPMVSTPFESIESR